ncbi:MAG: preprotein translocase subunit SecA, partial [Saprospiraceae bacterium]|nr:preprotein translocase subunit SecA [Saprospiraceae bacterium]
MLNYLSKSLKKVFGTKYDRDVAIYGPVVDTINEEYSKLTNISNDELRNKTNVFRQRIAEHLAGIDEDIRELKETIGNEKDLNHKEELYAELDKITKERDQHLEEVLKEMLPEAFAVVKETARRFSENETLEVTATQRDRDLAATASYVSVEGDKAVWKNSWTAAGGEITWNMIHYDVQLIGGQVLH